MKNMFYGAQIKYANLNGLLNKIERNFNRRFTDEEIKSLLNENFKDSGDSQYLASLDFLKSRIESYNRGLEVRHLLVIKNGRIYPNDNPPDGRIYVNDNPPDGVFTLNKDRETLFREANDLAKALTEFCKKLGNVEVHDVFYSIDNQCFVHPDLFHEYKSV